MKTKKIIKKILPKFLLDILINIYNTINRNIFYILIRTSPILALKFRYRINTNKRLNLKNPKNLNEKLQWLNIYWQHPLKIKCADKYEVRDYVKDCGCKEILNELYGVYNNTSEINWDELPNKFALKTTNSCGTNIICDNKKNFKKTEVFKKLENWLKTDYGKKHGELHYSKMKPKIICEKYLETNEGFLPNDYKIYCFNGMPKIVLICIERGIKIKKFFVNFNWNIINVVKTGNKQYNIGELPLKPECFNDIIKYSKILSKPFPFVRIDFYDYNDKPLLGEMTFTPYGGILSYHNKKALEKMGSWIKLPEKYKI